MVKEQCSRCKFYVEMKYSTTGSGDCTLYEFIDRVSDTFYYNEVPANYWCADFKEHPALEFLGANT
jgi:hypothetical protein